MEHGLVAWQILAHLHKSGRLRLRECAETRNCIKEKCLLTQAESYIAEKLAMSTVSSGSPDHFAYHLRSIALLLVICLTEESLRRQRGYPAATHFPLMLLQDRRRAWP